MVFLGQSYLYEESIVRFFNRSRWIYVAAVSSAALCALIAQGSRAQSPGSFPSGAENLQGAALLGGASGYGSLAGTSEGAGLDNAGKSSPYSFSVVRPDGELEQLTASRVYIYQMESDAAKPKLMGKNIDEGMARIYGRQGGGGMGGVNTIESMMGIGAMASAAGGATRGDKRTAGDFAFYALIFDEPEGESGDQDPQPTRARIKVALPASRQQQPLGGMFGAEEMGMSSEGGNLEYGSVFEEIDKMPGDRQTLVQQVYGNEGLGSIAGLIRLDVWIEDARLALRAKRNDPKAFQVTEMELRALLSQEYDMLLAKQRADAERLRKRLEQLQADLERRAKAKDRVVEVQLGKLVLEAQGLIDSRQ